jgi:hypothetical protein
VGDKVVSDGLMAGAVDVEEVAGGEDLVCPCGCSSCLGKPPPGGTRMSASSPSWEASGTGGFVSSRSDEANFRRSLSFINGGRDKSLNHPTFRTLADQLITFSIITNFDKLLYKFSYFLGIQNEILMNRIDKV